jgi:hypothetical protein
MQTANRRVVDFRRLVEVPLALDLFFADAVRFIPVQFSEANSTIPQSYPGSAFHLPPVALPIQATEPREIADSRSAREVGAAQDPVHRDRNVHFALESAERTRLRRGETQFMLKGVVTQANNPATVGLPVRIIAQTRGDTTAIAIAIGDLAFAGAGLVVIAIIAVLIALLLPAVQKV